jgi:hypothetical protein
MYTGNTFYSLLLTILIVVVGCVVGMNMLDSPPIGTLPPDSVVALNRQNEAAWQRALLTQNS